MMIQYHVGDLLEAPQELIAHGCNAQGVMGAGVAKAIKVKYPWAFKTYQERYKSRGLILGEVVMSSNNSKFVANCITQYTYGTGNGRHANYAAIAECFMSLNQIMEDMNLTEIAMPLIGCGLGGANPDQVKSLIYEEFKGDKTVHIYTLEAPVGK